MGKYEEPKPIPDNGVPGPGTYDIEEQYPVFEIENDKMRGTRFRSIPSFKIEQATKLNEK